MFGRADLFLSATVQSLLYLVVGAFGVPFVLAVLIVAHQDLELRDAGTAGGAAVRRWPGLPRCWRAGDRCAPRRRRSGAGRHSTPAAQGSMRAPTSASSASAAVARTVARLRVVPWNNLLPLEMNGGVTRDGRGGRDRREEISAAEPARARRAGALVEARSAKRDAPDDRQARAGARRARREGPAGRHALGALQALAQGQVRSARRKTRTRNSLARGVRPPVRDQRRRGQVHHLHRLRADGPARAVRHLARELRAAGLFGGSDAMAHAAQAAAQWRRRLQLTDVLAAPLSERPGLLLKLLGEALTRAHRLAGRRWPHCWRRWCAGPTGFRGRARRARQCGRGRPTPCATDHVPPNPRNSQARCSAARSLLEQIAQVKSSLFRRRT